MDLPTAQPALTPEQVNDAWKNWTAQREQLQALKASEIGWRKILVAHYFGDTPEEGTTRVNLGYGYDAVLEQGLSRKPIEELLDENLAQMRKKKIKVDELFPYKPTLSVSAYRELTDDQRALVDAVLEIKPESPQLSLKPTIVAEVPMPIGNRAPLPPGAAVVEVPPPPAPKLVLTDKATSQGLTFQSFYDQQWTDELLVEHGWARWISADTLEHQDAKQAGIVKPAGGRKRGPKPGSKRAPKK